MLPWNDPRLKLSTQGSLCWLLGFAGEREGSNIWALAWAHWSSFYQCFARMCIRCTPNFKVCYYPLLRNAQHLEDQMRCLQITLPTAFSTMDFSLVWQWCHSETSFPTSTQKSSNFSRPFHASFVFSFKLSTDSPAVPQPMVNSQNQVRGQKVPSRGWSISYLLWVS